MNPSGTNLLLLELSANPLQLLANNIVQQFSVQLPDLSNIVVLLPDSSDHARFRQLLLDECSACGHSALLNPTVTTLKHWIDKNIPSRNKTASGYLRELFLVEALLKHPHLYANSSPWMLADNLLYLFDELTRHRLEPFGSEDDFRTILKNAYGIPDDSLESLNREAKLVYTLWQAWHQQIQQEGMIDATADLIEKLTNTTAIPKHIHFYMLAGPDAGKQEKDWARKLYNEKRLTLALYREYAPEFDLATEPAQYNDSDFLYAVYNHTGKPLIQRIQDAKKQFDNPDILKHVSTANLNNAEAEAIAIDIQVRKWLLDGKKRIGIVTNDRRLGRRVRALLERANVHIKDTSGWALSTTRAAAVLERWLRTLEEDFNQAPMLDLLKSPFIFPHIEYKKRLELVYRLEQDVIRHESINNNLDRYRKGIELRKKQLNRSENISDELLSLIMNMEKSAQPLLRILKNPFDIHKAVFIIDCLLESLHSAGIYEHLAKDDAGERILQELNLMHQSALHSDTRINWTQWREWLGKTLEQYNFVQPSTDHHVQLVSLEQSLCADFEVVIIAGADTRHMPGSPAHTPFFNNNVYLQLGLPSQYHVHAERFFLFRRLLSSHQQVLITFHKDEGNNILQKCPWVELLDTFYKMTFNKSLDNAELMAMTNDPQAQIYKHDNSALPQPGTRPSLSVPASVLPDAISVSAHQNLIDCPYRFFVHHCLNLKQEEEVRETLAKDIYGQKIHLCLEAFHGGVKEHPGPFKQKITDENRHDAVKMLEEISLAVFHKELEDNFEHRGWYNQWKEAIPRYIDWQKEHNQKWAVSSIEENYKKEISAAISLKGRLDRIDKSNDGLAILDYKTGNFPSKKEMVSGEKVQLPSYRLLVGEQTHQAAFLEIGKEKVAAKAELAEDELEILSGKVGHRLAHMFEELHSGARMTAWGDQSTCEKCDASGICRKGAWLDE